jgi:hypothetical protein
MSGYHAEIIEKTLLKTIPSTLQLHYVEVLDDVVFAAVRRKRKMHILHNDHLSKRGFSSIHGLRIVDGKPLYFGWQGKQACVVWGEKVSAPYDKIVECTVIDGELFYIAQTGGVRNGFKKYVHWNGVTRRIPEHEIGIPRVFDGTLLRQYHHPRQVAYRPKRKTFIQWGDVKSSLHAQITHPCVADNMLLYVARDNSHNHIVFGGSWTNPFIIWGDQRLETSYRDIGPVSIVQGKPLYVALKAYNYSAADVRSAATYVVVWGDEISPEYQYVSTVEFVDNKVLYIARDNEGPLLVWGEKTWRRSTTEASSTAIPSDDADLARLAALNSKLFQTWFADPTETDPFSERSVVNGKALYIRRNRKSSYIVWDGAVASPEFFRIDRSSIRSIRGKLLYVVCQKNRTYTLVWDNQPIGPSMNQFIRYTVDEQTNRLTVYGSIKHEVYRFVVQLNIPSDP